MSKIKNVGSGFISLNESLLNLRAFKEIKKEYLSFEVDDDQYFSISFTPINPKLEDLENGVEGTWLIRYSDEKERDDDFDTIQESLRS